MLFMSSANRIIRIHGPFVSRKRNRKNYQRIEITREPEYVDEITNINHEQNNFTANDESEDELFSQASEIIKEGKAFNKFFTKKTSDRI